MTIRFGKAAVVLCLAALGPTRPGVAEGPGTASHSSERSLRLDPRRLRRAGEPVGAKALESRATTVPAFDWIGTPKAHTERVAGSGHAYEVVMGGTVDAENTLARGYDWIKLYQPNVSLKIANAGRTPVVNPRVVVNGRGDWRSTESILGEILREGMSDREKALAIWHFVKEKHYRTFPSEDWTGEVHSPVKSLNVYGYGLCGELSFVAMALWKKAGLSARLWNLNGHTVSDVWFDGAYRILDPTIESFYLLPDNQTIATAEQVSADHYLAKRAYHYGRFAAWPAADSALVNEMVASLYGHDDLVFSDDLDAPSDEIALTLRPGESFEWRWDNIGKYHDIVGEDIAPSLFANGKASYEPVLEEGIFQEFLESEDNVTISPGGDAPRVHLRAEGRSGRVVFRIEAPYAMVGGRIRGEFYRQTPDEQIHVYVSSDNDNWTRVGTVSGAGRSEEFFSIDAFVAARASTAKYRYWVMFEFGSAGSRDAVGIDRIQLETDVQLAPMALPALRLGLNRMEYRDDTAELHDVRIQHEWREVSPTRPPDSALAPLFPLDGSEVQTTRPTFEWPTAADPDGDEVVDYHFMLSDREDMAWPLSANFDLVFSSSRLELSHDGMFRDGVKYYWRVRSRDTNGVWSQWSPTWSFVPHGPAAPVNVRMSDTNTLSWSPGPEGTVPVYYEVYASNEKGFAPSRESFVVMTHFVPDAIVTETIASNLVTTAQETSLRVISGTPSFPNQNSYYYRVVAVDAHGVRSAPSLMASVDKEFVYTTPVTEVETGETYDYQVGVVYSIGDLAFFAMEPIPYRANILRYSLLEGPDWLTMDRQGGRITGVAERGMFDAELHIVNEMTQASSYQHFELRVFSQPKESD